MLGVYKKEMQLAGAYFALACFSILTTRFDLGLAYVWLPAALLITVLKRRPRRTWAPVLTACGVASCLATTLVGAGPLAALPLALANLSEAIVAAFIMRRFHSSKRPLGSTGWMATLIVAAGIAGPLAMGLVAALPMSLLFAHDPLSTLERVIVGHGLSNIIGVPIFALFAAGLRDSKADRQHSGKRLELVALFSVQIVINVAAFLQTTVPLLFLAVLPTVVIAFRATSRDAALSLIVLAIISGTATFEGFGPINMLDGSTVVRLQLLCFYLTTIVLTITPIAAGLRTNRRLMRRVSDSEQRYRMLADHSGDIIMHTDADGRIKFVSPSIERVGGYKVNELVDTNCLDMIHPASRQAVEAHYRFALSGGLDTRFEYRARRNDGRWSWFESDCRGVTDIDGARGVVSVVRDIGERKAREEQLATAAMTDPLTGLPNRRAFREAALQILHDQRVRSATIAILDIDHFKTINDTYGHDAGDEVLQSFAAVAQRLGRKGDLMARIGGEEFGILLPDTRVAAAVAVCDRLRAEVAGSVCMTAKGPIAITISGGVAPLMSDGLDQSLCRADEALYRAKRAGRDRLLKAEAA